MEDKSAQAKESMQIDLSLAINYLPAVECFTKTLLVALSVCLVNPAEHLGAFSVLFLSLTIDRAVSSGRIFDGNAILLSVLLSFFVNTLRAGATAPAPVPPIASLIWSSFSVVLAVEPKPVQEFFVLYGQSGGGRARQVLPAVINCFFVGFLTFLPLPTENNTLRIAKSMCFCTLCILWVYIVTIWRNRPRNCVFFTHALVARFSPLLYFTPPFFISFTLVSVAVLGYHYMQIHMAPLSPPLPEPQPLSCTLNVIQEEEEDLEALLQAAKRQNM